MRFSTVALVAGAAVARAGYEYEPEPVSTDYTTEYYTITSCPPTEYDCPASSTAVHSSVYPVYTSTVYSTEYYVVTKCPDHYYECPYEEKETKTVTEVHPVSTTVCPLTDHASPTPYYNSTLVPVHPGPEPSHEPVEPIHEPVGTGAYYPPVHTPSPEPECPSVSVKTIHTSYTTVIPTVVYETYTVDCPETHVPAHSGSGVVHTTGAIPVTTEPVTAGASIAGVSFVMAAAAGLIAFLA